MTDIDELLRETGGAWRPPEPPPIRLDAVLARRDRLRGATAAVAAVVVLAGGGLAWANWPGRGIPAEPSGTPMPSSAATGGATSPGTPSVPASKPTVPAAKLAELTQLARDDALANARGGVPVTAQAVRTTLERAYQAVGEEPPAQDGQHQVWLVQLRGLFVCDGCSRPLGAESPTGTVLQRIVDQPELANGWFSLGINRRPADLAGLGEVIDLDLGELTLQPLPTPDTEFADLTRAVRQVLAGLPEQDVLTGTVVATTMGNAQAVLVGHTPYPPSADEVWFVELQGQFHCPDCFAPGEVKKSDGAVLTLVIDQRTDEVSMKVISADAVRFAPLKGTDPQRLPTPELSIAAGRQPQFASYPRAEGGDGALAQLEGQLLLIGGCLAVEADDGPLYLPVLPTPATIWSAVDRTLTVGDHPVGIGERVSWVGGYTTTPVVGGSIPEPCAGLAQEYFRVDSA